uniref:Uncharacterized protein n=1 Tax=Arundo donax TaxID=35708 RepID=A0A0A9F8J6_ARUDO
MQWTKNGSCTLVLQLTKVVGRNEQMDIIKCLKMFIATIYKSNGSSKSVQIK